jgi:hypothetical protein
MPRYRLVNIGKSHSDKNRNLDRLISNLSLFETSNTFLNTNTKLGHTTKPANLVVCQLLPPFASNQRPICKNDMHKPYFTSSYAFYRLFRSRIHWVVRVEIIVILVAGLVVTPEARDLVTGQTRKKPKDLSACERKECVCGEGWGCVCCVHE